MVSATLLRRVKFFPLLLVLLQMSGCNSEKFDAEAFLERYGYMEPSSNISSSYSIINPREEAIKRFQRNFGLPVTGRLDRNTESKMKTPRCGVKDPVASAYSATPYKWDKGNLTYVVYNGNLPWTITYNEARQEIRKAFNAWSAVTSLDFTEVYHEEADIKIWFGEKYHFCKDLFDEELAHAYFPKAGLIHINNWYLWKSERSPYNFGTKLLGTVAHEIGHTLGLDHSNNRYAVMYPTLEYENPNPILHKDDVKGIQSLYGSRKRKPRYYGY